MNILKQSDIEAEVHDILREVAFDLSLTDAEYLTMRESLHRTKNPSRLSDIQSDSEHNVYVSPVPNRFN